MKKNDIRERREALGIKQTEFALEVSKRAGKSFSQQALQKLETKEEASSRFMHHIIELLEEMEGGDRARIKKEVDRISDKNLKIALAYLEGLNQSEESE